MNRHYTATAVRWSGGWELHIEDVGVTQVRTLDKAPQQVRDYLESLLGEDASHVDVSIVPELGELSTRVETARRAVIAAAEAQQNAAAANRQVARDLRAAGLSVSDMAAIMHVSRGRVSQLVDA